MAHSSTGELLQVIAAVVTASSLCPLSFLAWWQGKNLQDKSYWVKKYHKLIGQAKCEQIRSELPEEALTDATTTNVCVWNDIGPFDQVVK